MGFIIGKANMKKKLWFVVILLMISFGLLQNQGRSVTAQAEKGNSMEKIKIYNVQKGQFELLEKVIKSDEEWQKQLSPMAYKVLRKKGTEPAFCGIFEHQKEAGIYQCAGCATDIYASKTKFDSGTGWPSFFAPVAEENVRYGKDWDIGYPRTEVLCARCGGHLGHVFDDGPPPTHKRYCINSAALQFVPEKK